ncbi:unnamed protein product (macronuclear) [Paramecium tetraurelia]|uniref:Uncharacterized protein n=1 Tax=Paramecium tetraurelia TaxID=5888 RepID=A0CIB4_PARTE|nr:uncharacterized protein GSPATT00007666001 [Paramecium tetraurelia]CAK70531.1 unnamed protein product [Paramecium tetraurelia]|eukprot:XP_001437928.1 hypothetical protein (macronuclear) [Paramecium tetraurelia strain d4-2]
MSRITRQNQRATYSLNQSMTNGLPALTPDNMNLCISQFYGRRPTQRIYESPNNDIYSGRQHLPYQKDIEQLKEEIIYLKKENARLKDQNKQLQFQIKLDEKEQLDKRTTQEVSDDQINYNQSSRLVEKLKQARMMLQERQAEIDNLKKSTRYMKLQEMELELGNTKSKFEILNKQINEILKTENDVHKFHKLTIQTVELEEKLRILSNCNQKQKRKILSLRQELLTCQAMKDRYRKQFEQCQVDFDKYKKNHEQEIQKKTRYKEIIDNLNQQLTNKQNVIQSMQMEIEKQKLLVFQKQRQFKELEEQYQTKKSWLTNRKEADTSFQEVLDDRVNKNLVLGDDDLSNSYKQQSETKIVLEEDHRDRSYTMQNRLSVDSVRDEQKSPRVQSLQIIPDIEVTKQKLPRVNHIDVEEIGKRLKYQLMYQQVPFEQINQFFDQKSEISIVELVDILQGAPFCMQQQKQALLLARYLIEDNTQPYVEFTPLQTNDNCVIKSVLKNIIGKYQLFDIQSECQIMINISQQIWKFRQSIVEQIKMITAKRSSSQYNELCDEGEFKIAIQGSNILLDERQKEFLGFFIFREFDGSKQFDYKMLIDKIGNQNPQNSPSKINPQQFQ